MMMMIDNNKFKLRISRIFHGSCKSRDDVTPYHDVLEKSPLLPRSPSVLPAPPRPPPLPLPSICNPRTPPSIHINNTCIISSKEVQNFVHPPKLKTRSRSRSRSRSKSKSKSPVAAFSHFAYHPFYDRGGSRYSTLKDDRGKKKKISDDHDFFSSNNKREDEEVRTADTLFSSRSLSSSESSEKNRRRTRNGGSRRTAAQSKDSTGVRGSMAVVKKSRDPYGDFRRSMVEMIIERQIFGEEELEQLLLCFLSLNSIHLHNIIVKVFNEIMDALFSM